MSVLARTALVALALSLGSCKSLYYGTMARFGVDKRDILIDRTESLGESLDRLSTRVDAMASTYRDTIHMEGGDLPAMHKKFSRSYDATEKAAKSFHERIADIHSVAGAFFDDWKEESAAIVDEELRKNSLGNYGMVQRRYTELVRTMRAVEAELDPVLTRFHDHVVYLKINLHRNTLVSLQQGEEELFADVTTLQGHLEKALLEAREFSELVDY